jgi:hypothetical protein
VFHQCDNDAAREFVTKAPDHTAATLGWNLHHDHRIPIPRKQDWGGRFQSFNSGPDGDQWAAVQRATKRYHTEEIRESHDPAFLRPNNQDNFYVPHFPGGPRAKLTAPHGDVRLVRVLNLGAMGPVFTHLNDTTFRPFTGISATDPLNWLDEQLQSFKANPGSGLAAGNIHHNAFLSAILKTMAQLRTAHPFEPTWATLWADFAPQGQLPPSNRWLDVLGVALPAKVVTYTTWLLVLRYEVRRVGQLVRPSQLEAGWYPEHFPIPPSADWGHAMDLGDQHPLPPLPLREYIHRQIEHRAEDLVAIARVELTALPGLLPSRQARHLDRLAGQYRDTREWPNFPHPAYR